MAKEEKVKMNCSKTTVTIDDFYLDLQKTLLNMEQDMSFRYVTSRSTEENVHTIQELCSKIKHYCKIFFIPTEGIFLRKTDLSVKAFKYLICNTNFISQSLLAEDTASGYLVDVLPSFSPYLLVEILWHINFEDILAESILHFPLDLCIEILEVLPRCLDLLNFQRASKFLTSIIPNSYKKLIILRDSGSQSRDITGNAKKLAGSLQELILQFTNERFLKFEGVPQNDQFKRYGTLLKTIIQMVRTCLTSKSKKVELPCEMAKMYKLTFGWEPIEKINDPLLQTLLTEIDRELINLLLKKVKEIDCNIYLNWMEHEDEENTSLTLQRAIGLECHFFIENTKEFQDSNVKEYKHLVECLRQIASTPDPDNSVESLQLADLCCGAREGRKDCLLALFRRYKEWDDSTVDSVDSNISSLSKNDCEELFEYLAAELSHSQEQLDAERLQLFTLCLAKALVYLKITELYEITIKFIMKFSEDDNLDNIIDIINFESFIMHNPNFSTAKNLRVVLFFVCLKTRLTLKILLKMAIGHSDYPDVAVSLDDLVLLLPILKIQTSSKYSSMIEALRVKCSEKENGFRLFSKTSEHIDDKQKNITLAVRIIQDICLESPGWNASKFANLLQLLYSFCSVSEVVNQILTPFLMSDACSLTYLKYTLIELHKLIGKYDRETSPNVIRALEMQALYLLKSNHISRYVVDELLNLITELIDHMFDVCEDTTYYEPVNSNYYYIFVKNSRRENVLPAKSTKNRLKENIGRYMSLHQGRMSNMLIYPIRLIVDDVIRHLFLNCTKKQYLEYADEIITSYGKILNWTNNVDICDNIIRLTLETCLLCLEYPEISASDSIGFLLRCLMQLLPIVPFLKKKDSFHRSLCCSLDTHIAIFKSSIECTAISDAYNELLERCQESKATLIAHLDAYEQFAIKCMHESENLRHFDGLHSPIAIKLWLAHDTVSEVLDSNATDEEYFGKLGTYFNKSQSIEP